MSRRGSARSNLVDIGSLNKPNQASVTPIPAHQVYTIPAGSQGPAGLMSQMPMQQGMMHRGMVGGMVPQSTLNTMQASGTVPGANPAAPVKPLVIDSSIAIQIANCSNSTYQERNLMARNDIWHNIVVVRGARYDKEKVLKCILKSVHPADLIPVRYQIVGNDACFLARNCDRALDALCKTSLIVQYIDGSPLILSITLGYASIHDLKINIQPLLLQVLKKRYKIETKVLNLEDFHRDPDIYNMVYCPLSQNKTFVHVLKLARTVSGAFDYLILKSNELTTLPLASLEAMKFVKHLDLRFNNLLRVQDLEHLKPYNITELWLDGNPLCDNYSNSIQYVEAVREYCPKLIKLDGIMVNEPGLPLIFKTYAKNEKRKKLVEQFVEHFFTAYDHKDRSVLRGLYSKDAWYSMTVGTPTTPTSKKLLEPFSSENRNLLIFGKNSQELIRHGEDQILKILKKLPASRHVFKSFYVDLIFDSNDYVTLAVDGLFNLVNVKNQLFSFNRLFVLAPEDDNEYKIMNDQYHIYLPVQPIDYKAYNAEDDKRPEFEASCLSPSERANLLVRFQDWTTMKLEYCERYLREAEWDTRKALSNFMIDYKNRYVAEEAFS